MKSSDRMIVLALAGIGLAAAFWFVVLAPKRAEVKELDEKVAVAQAAAEEQEQLAAFAEVARQDYAKDYQQLVVLGKAVPADSDQASLVEQVNGLAAGAGIDFDALVLAAGDGAAAAPAPTAPAPPAEGAGAVGAPAATGAAPATEAAVAALPIGATVGPAGLPVMPYELAFRGGFFEVADFMAALDGMVKTEAKLKGKGKGKKKEKKRDAIGVGGRLLTVDGFALSPNEQKGFPLLDATLQVTSFVAPADQGVTGGATPTEPAPSTSLTTTPTTPPVATTTAPTP